MITITLHDDELGELEVDVEVTSRGCRASRDSPGEPPEFRPVWVRFLDLRLQIAFPSVILTTRQRIENLLAESDAVEQVLEALR